MTLDMKTVKDVKLNGQTVIYIHDLNNNQLWPYNGPKREDQFYIQNEYNGYNRIGIADGSYGLPDLELEYSTDNIHWQYFGKAHHDYSTASYPELRIYTGVKIYLRSRTKLPWGAIVNNNISSWRLTAEHNCSIGGNIMTLLGYDELKGYDCYKMFANMPIIGIPADLLPASVMADYSYGQMFANCDNVTLIPRGLLKSTALAPHCYEEMFASISNNNTNLMIQKDFVLPATVLAESCYERMFYNCLNLQVYNQQTSTNMLPATTLSVNCYKQMFSNCSNNLGTYPYLEFYLPAINLVSGCYNNMFYHCNKMTYIKAMFTTDISSDETYTRNWLSGTSSTGTFVKNANATWIRSDASGTNGWTVQTVNP